MAMDLCQTAEMGDGLTPCPQFQGGETAIEKRGDE